MANLKVIFELYDGYSNAIDKINRKIDEATNKILKVSGSNDKLNNKLEKTGSSSNVAGGGLDKLIGKLISLADVQKGISIADEYTSTSERLKLVNDGLQTQAQLQDKIFAAAERSRGSYSNMAGAISDMGLMASEAFGSNDELIAFTELIQKGVKLGGTSQTEQSSTMLQLTQAMGAGKLQGDDFSSIMKNAPMIADAIAKYTGKSKDELKDLSSEGFITSDIIKNAVFMAAKDINGKFEAMPMTFADVWNKIKNGGLQAFDGIINKVNGLFKTDGFMQFINCLIIGFDLLGKVAGWLVDTIINGWDTIGPILAIIGGVLLAGMIGKLIAMIPLWLANAAAVLSFAWPILLVVGIIGLVISAARQLGASWEQIFGFIGAIVGVAVAGIWNLFLGLFEYVLGIISYWANKFVIFANFVCNVFINPISSIIYLFQGMADNVLGMIEKIASAMDFVFGSNMADTVSSWRSGLKEMADAAVAKYAPNEDYQKIIDTVDLSASDFGFGRMDYTDSWDKGDKTGKDAYAGLNDSLSGFTDTITSGKGTEGFNSEDFGTKGNPMAVQGTGKNDAVDVEMEDEDLSYLRDIAEREYINKFSTATLAPNIQVTFGDVHENADASLISGKIQKILQEEIAMSAEGVY